MGCILVLSGTPGQADIWTRLSNISVGLVNENNKYRKNITQLNENKNRKSIPDDLKGPKKKNKFSEIETLT